LAADDGRVDALDLALRKDLGVYQKPIEDLELRDYRVRVFQGGADAVTRVLIEFGDGNGDTWSTVGVSGNIIDASFQALADAITYRLVKLGVPAQ
jgi:2-isopropylmalate synthase